MRKIFTAAAVLLAAASTIAHAEGYQINTLSAKQQGMGHVGVAMKLGTESQFFNPAGLGFLDKTLDMSASVTAISATADCTTDGRKYTTSNGISTPLFVSAAFNIYNNLKAGISFYTPYGSGINWGDNWAGAELNQKVSLKVYTVQPTVAWRITPKLSVGAGAMISWGSVDLSKGLVSPKTVDMLLQAQGVPQANLFGTTMPASVNLSGKSQLAVGLNAGVMYDISERVTVGAQFRTHMEMKVKSGDASVTYANQLASGMLEGTLNLIDAANFTAKMPCPYVLDFGVSYKPVSRLILSAEAQLTGWKTYKELNIEFLDEKLASFNQHITKDYSNAWAFKVGAQYGLTQRFDVRAGLMIDTSPVNEEYYNPETPGMTKLNPSVGLSFRPIDNLSFDVAFVYVAGLGVDGASCSYKDLLMSKVAQQEVMNTFKADYKVHAFIPSLGISYRF